MLQKNDFPISVILDPITGIFNPCPEIVQRHVSQLKNVFHDTQAVGKVLANEDPLVYEFRFYPFITSKSDMALGVTRIFPGKVGDEYHMTKGHLHERDDQPEIYYCVHGTGYLLLDTLQGEFEAIPWQPGVISHIPPMWAHRVVNTGDDLMVFVASYSASAGHDYTAVEKKGFTKIVVEQDGHPTLIARNTK